MRPDPRNRRDRRCRGHRRGRCMDRGGFSRRLRTRVVLGIEVLSSQPELVSGRRCAVLTAATEAPVVTSLGSADLSDAFRPAAKGPGRPRYRPAGRRQPLRRQGWRQASEPHPRQSSAQRHGLRRTAGSCAKTRPMGGARHRRLLRGAFGGKMFLPRQGRRVETVRPPGRRGSTDIGTTKTTEGKEVPRRLSARRKA